MTSVDVLHRGVEHECADCYGPVSIGTVCRASYVLDKGGTRPDASGIYLSALIQRPIEETTSMNARKLAALLGALALTFSAATTVLATGQSVDICHRSDSETNPYIAESPAIDSSGYLHGGHQDHTGPVWYPGAKADSRPAYLRQSTQEAAQALRDLRRSPQENAVLLYLTYSPNVRYYGVGEEIENQENSYGCLPTSRNRRLVLPPLERRGISQVVPKRFSSPRFSGAALQRRRNQQLVLSTA